MSIDEPVLVSVLVEVETTHRAPEAYVRTEIERALRERFIPSALRITPLPRLAEIMPPDPDEAPGPSPDPEDTPAPITPDQVPPDVSGAPRPSSWPPPDHEPRPFPGPLDHS